MSSAYYSTESLSQLWDVPRNTIRMWIRRGDFKGVLKFGKHIRIPHESRVEFERKHIQTK